MSHRIITTRTVTVEYDEEGRVARETTVTVEEADTTNNVTEETP